MKKFKGNKRIAGILGLLAVCSLLAGVMAKEAQAASARDIDARVDAALGRFYGKVRDGKKLVERAKGVLIFPSVSEGALRIHGLTAAYYNLITTSFGLQIGAEKNLTVILFMKEKELNRFRQTSEWKAGTDGSITVLALDAAGRIDTQKFKEPIIAFIIGQNGMIYYRSLEGSRFTKLHK